jgi:hypothetical protein
VAPRRLLGVLVLALLVGLVWMHALGGGHASASAMAGHNSAATASADDACGDHDGSSPCPDRPDHPGPVCQAGAVTGGIVLAPAASGGAIAPSPPEPVKVSTATVAGDAGTGTGCGPPSLNMLSISRT